MGTYAKDKRAKVEHHILTAPNAGTKDVNV